MTVREALASLSPPPTSIQTSVVSQTVTVEHSAGLSSKLIKEALDEKGFDLVESPVLSSCTLHRSQSDIHLSRKREKHAENCMLCREGSPSPPDSSTASLACPSPQSPTISGAEDDAEQFQATFSVGGMTCASCTQTITQMVSELNGVSDVNVSLLTKSATIVVDGRDRIDAIRDTMEDCGFECELVSLEAINASKREKTLGNGPREISLRVDGMFCRHCPGKLENALKPFDSQVSVIGPLPSHTDRIPILRLSYQPSPPHLTIRTIISTLSSSKSPPFSISIARPASLEERARVMHEQEQYRLLIRLIFCIIIAIPTFIIGIIYMTLVPASNPTRVFFMSPMWTGNTSRAQWAMFFLATPVMFFSAGLFHLRSLKELRALWRRGSKTPIWKRFVRFGSMNLLVSMGVSIAYFASIALLALASAQPTASSGMADTTTYFDSVVFLTMFLLAGRCLEAYSKTRTADAINALGKLRPTEAILVVPNSVQTQFSTNSDEDLEKGPTDADGGASLDNKPGFHIEKVSTDLLEVGDVVRVLHGSTPPADGTVITIEGSAFDESSLTGESKPVKKGPGDTVFVGTINKGKVVDIEIAAVGGETMLDQIVKVVREGQTKRAPIERVADLLTGYFVPVITLLAIITWVVWLALGLGGALPPDYLDIPIGGWAVWSLEFAIAVFVVACPCGIGLAAPTALLVGAGLAAKFGILVRGGGEAFQEAAQLDIIVFDKTGTLTQGGELQVTDADINDESEMSWTKSTILSIATTLESASSHPLAAAITRYCGTKQVEMHSSAVSIEETAGRGLVGSFSSLSVTAIIGNESWMNEHDAWVASAQGQLLQTWKSQGKSVVLLAVRDDSGAAIDVTFKVVAMFAAADPLRSEARDVVQRLQEQGLGTWMISGDNVVTANAIARSVGIPEMNVIAGVLPQQKAEKIAWLQKNGVKRSVARWTWLASRRLNERCIVAMVGDGINDAPALMTADVSLAIGSGSDVAISSASFILLKSNLYSILTLTDLSRKVFRRVKFNFLWAVVYNLIGLPIAAGVIYPAGHARLDPVWASLAMALSSVTVVLSSLLLRLYKEPVGSRGYVQQ